VEGTNCVTAPVAGVVSAVNIPERNRLGSERWLVELVLAETAALPDFVDEDAYLAACGVGTFGESVEALGYSSYG
jgi:hypothetical protein